MSEFPTRKLADLIESPPEYGANASAQPMNGRDPRFLRITDLTDEGVLKSEGACSIPRDFAAPYILEHDDLLLARSGSVGRSYLHDKANGELAFAGYLIRFRLNQELISPRFLSQFLRSQEYWRWVGRTLRVGAQPNINAKEYSDLDVPYCDPDEQRRIAEILDTADEAIQKTEALIAKLKQMKSGLLHDLLTRGIDENGELRPLDCEKQKLPVGAVPADWDIEECEQLCSEITVGIVIRPTQYYTTTGVPVLRSANVKPNGIDGSDLVFMSEESNQRMAKSMVRAGDVITVRTGYPGTTCVVCKEFDRSNCVDILISRPTEAVIPEFLAIWINSDFGKGQVLRQQTGLAQQHFNVGELKELLIAKPDLPEQERIVTRLVSAQDRIEEEHDVLEKLQLVKAGLMHDLLTGKKRVNQPAVATA